MLIERSAVVGRFGLCWRVEVLLCENTQADQLSERIQFSGRSDVFLFPGIESLVTALLLNAGVKASVS